MPPRNRYTWDEASARYRNARTGRFVARSTVRRGLSRAVTTAERLGAFARQIEAGLPLDGRFVRRAMMYGSSGRETFERTQGLVLLARGFDEVRSIRHASDSCDGCVEQAKKGWQDPNGYVYPGRRDCLTACLCTSQWRNRRTRKLAA